VTPIYHDVVGAAALFSLFLAVIGTAELCIRKAVLAPEAARKAIHVAGGLGCAFFPFLVASWVTVLILSVLFSFLLFAGERQRRLKALSSVARSSLGSLLFPLAILLLFIVAKDRLWLYLSALLVLVLADSAAALVGTHFGKIRYQTAPGEWKSLEGTLAFCGVGFLAVLLTLCILSDLNFVTCLLTASLMAVLLAGLESVSIGGTDNIFTPLATLYLLLKIPDKPHIEIVFQCMSLLAFSWLLFWINSRHQTFLIRPLVVFILITYAAWALGSADWMLPALSGFILYNRLCAPCGPRPSDPSALRLLRPLYPSIFILFVANTTMSLAFWLGPYLAATSVATTLCIVERYRLNTKGARLVGLKRMAALLLPATVPCLLCVPIQGPSVLKATPTLITLVLGASLLHHAFARQSSADTFWRYWIGLCASFAALTYTALQFGGFLAPLAPSTWKEVFR